MFNALTVNLVSRFYLNRRVPTPPRLIKAPLPCGDSSQQIQLMRVGGKFAVMSQHGFGFEQSSRLRKFRGACEPDLSKAILKRGSRLRRQLLFLLVHAKNLPAHDSRAVTPLRLLNCFVWQQIPKLPDDVLQAGGIVFRKAIPALTK